ncbi:hypothetical protein GCM10022255_007050 [Dactylosporangium darangshiense]|uniref:Uncharacterized protein n=1 Tax=Dactylosporangium darangshiense TaxID=579108 RepID=A0ABP8CXD3_9ACTN
MITTAVRIAAPAGMARAGGRARAPTPHRLPAATRVTLRRSERRRAGRASCRGYAAAADLAAKNFLKATAPITSGDQAAAMGEDYQVDSIPDIQLGEQVGDVGLGGTGSDV